MPHIGDVRVASRARKIGRVRIMGSTGISVTIGTHIWIHWLNVASDRHQAAREDTREDRQPGGDWRPVRGRAEAQLHASMVGISASAHAIDGIYGELMQLGYVPTALVRTWNQNDTPSSPTGSSRR